MIKSKAIKYFEVLLLIIFIGYYSGVTMFYHTHVINGVTVVHSHPFMNLGNSSGHPIKHTHSQNSLGFIQFVTHFVSTIVSGYFFIKLYLLFLTKYKIPVTDFARLPYRDTGCFLRAPPAYY